MKNILNRIKIKLYKHKYLFDIIEIELIIALIIGGVMEIMEFMLDIGFM